MIFAEPYNENLIDNSLYTIYPEIDMANAKEVVAKLNGFVRYQDCWKFALLRIKSNGGVSISQESLSDKGVFKQDWRGLNTVQDKYPFKAVNSFQRGLLLRVDNRDVKRTFYIEWHNPFVTTIVAFSTVSFIKPTTEGGFESTTFGDMKYDPCEQRCTIKKAMNEIYENSKHTPQS